MLSAKASEGKTDLLPMRRLPQVQEREEGRTIEKYRDTEKVPLEHKGRSSLLGLPPTRRGDIFAICRMLNFGLFWDGRWKGAGRGEFWAEERKEAKQKGTESPPKRCFPAGEFLERETPHTQGTD